MQTILHKMGSDATNVVTANWKAVSYWNQPEQMAPFIALRKAMSATIGDFLDQCSLLLARST
jgi:hypothetical protein